MSRLIDADALIEVIKKYKFGAISNESEREYTREIMLCFVNGSSTAYSVEKVVAELGKESYEIRLEGGALIDSWHSVIDKNKAIDIVRKGGV